MYTQNVSIPPDYFTWRSAVPSQSDSELNWREENEANNQQKEGNMKRDATKYSIKYKEI